MSTVPDEASATLETHRKPPFLRRVRIRNFKSIKFCDVTLEPLTVLVGRNGSGKSNFVEALAFLRDVITWGTEKSVQEHGGQSVKFRTDHEPVSIVVEYCAPSWTKIPEDGQSTYRYTLELVGIADRPRVSSERLEDLTLRKAVFEAFDSNNETGIQIPKMFQYHGLARPLQSIQEYNFDPGEMRRPQRDNRATLSKNGSNVASIFSRIKWGRDGNLRFQRVKDYFQQIVSEVLAVESVQIADHDVLRFSVDAGPEPLLLFAASMSDGTLRAFATLVAAYQSNFAFGPQLVAIEEPETSLHPAAMHALVDALDGATGRTQILLTTHSSELLDNPTIRPENVRVVEMVNGETVITPVDEASVEIVKQQLDTLGGLERQNQLALNDADRDRQQQLAAGAEPK